MKPRSLLITFCSMWVTNSVSAQCGTGDCCSATFAPGCNDEQCCQLVCDVFPSCCDVAWGFTCASLAAQLCSNCGGPDCLGSGPCCTAHDTPFCNDATCCEAVCKIDPFCCERQWDQGCVLIAAEHCPGQSNCNPFTCTGYCGGQGPAGCWCDELCFAYGDCCPFACYDDQCPGLAGCQPEVTMCQGWCGAISGSAEFADCDEIGVHRGTTHPDVCHTCPEIFACQPINFSMTCADFCGAIVPYTGCFCDDLCCQFNDCCADAHELCGVRCGPPFCPADIDRNHSVGGEDLGALLLAWGKCGQGDCAPDLIIDGQVDGQDLGELLLAWGACKN